MRRLMAVRALIAAVAIGGLISVSSGSASAQDSGEEVALLITVLNCESAEQLGAGPCEPAAGVEVSVASTDGEALGSCMTEAGTIQNMDVGYCYVDVPVGEVVVTENVGTVAEGYAPVENPRTVEVRTPDASRPDYLPVATFFNVPEADEQPDTDEGTGEEDGDTDEPTDGASTPPRTTLPNTGAGPMPGQPRFDLTATAVMLAAVGAALALCGRFAR